MKLATVRKYAMSLPEVSEAPHHDFGSFRVRGKIFVTVPPGDALIHVFVPEHVREEALTLHAAFAEKLLWGAKALGLRVRLADADPKLVKHWVRQAWAHKAPKMLAASLPEHQG